MSDSIDFNSEKPAVHAEDKDLQDELNKLAEEDIGELMRKAKEEGE